MMKHGAKALSVPVLLLLAVGCERQDQCMLPLSELGCKPGDDCYTYKTMSAGSKRKQAEN